MELARIVFGEADHDPAVRGHIPIHIRRERLYDIGEHALDIPEFVPHDLVREKGAFDLEVWGEDLDKAVLRPILFGEINNLPLDNDIPSGVGSHI